MLNGLDYLFAALAAIAAGGGTLITETTNQLWKDVTQSRAKFEPTTVIKD